MADVNVSVTADRTPITVAIVRLITTELYENTDILRVNRSQEMSEKDATTQERIFRLVYAAKAR
jgi:hypothetical protein